MLNGCLAHLYKLGNWVESSRISDIENGVFLPLPKVNIEGESVTFVHKIGNGYFAVSATRHNEIALIETNTDGEVLGPYRVPGRGNGKCYFAPGVGYGLDDGINDEPARI